MVQIVVCSRWTYGRLNTLYRQCSGGTRSKTRNDNTKTDIILQFHLIARLSHQQCRDEYKMLIETSNQLQHTNDIEASTHHTKPTPPINTNHGNVRRDECESEKNVAADRYHDAG